jgi:O-methyltransferase
MIPDLPALYVETVKRSVAGLTHESAFELRPATFEPGPSRRLNSALAWVVGAAGRLSGQDLALVRRIAENDRRDGGPWPLVGETMIGARRLDHLQTCVESVLADDVDGDLIEAGVWRGGAAILIRAILAAQRVSDRSVWVADSFAGVPAPDPDRHPADAGYRLHRYGELAVGLDRVRANFERYGLLDAQVRFVPGRFRDTLPGLRGHRWALIRLDGDLAEATSDSLENLYSSLSPGGYVIVDDYGAVRACRRAVDDFRSRHGVREPIEAIDASAVAWRRDGSVS